MDWVRLPTGGPVNEYPEVTITKEMLEQAEKLVPSSTVHRTKTSAIDTLVGHIGEYAFCEWFEGNWKKAEVGNNKGKVDFRGLVEIKASVYPFRDTLNLLVRQDYAEKRKPPFYVQVIINVPNTEAKQIPVGTKAIICGFATAEEVDSAPLWDTGSKFGGSAGYKCYKLPIKSLHKMSEFTEWYYYTVTPEVE